MSKVLVISGTHGNETNAVQDVYDLKLKYEEQNIHDICEHIVEALQRLFGHIFFRHFITSFLRFYHISGLCFNFGRCQPPHKSSQRIRQGGFH